jgi:hypothetical protein
MLLKNELPGNFPGTGPLITALHDGMQAKKKEPT